jgi:hypothetical protein
MRQLLLIALFVLTTSALMLAQDPPPEGCPNACDWTDDHCTGCSNAVPNGSQCTCLGSYCYFGSCNNAKNEQCGEFKLAASTSSFRGVRLIYVPLQYGPVRIGEVVSRGPGNLLHSATAHNVSRESVQTIRIGWVIVSADPIESPQVGLSEPIQLIEALKPQGVSTVLPSSSIRVQQVQAGSTIHFFVAEAKFASGRLWTVDLDQLKWGVARITSRRPLDNTPRMTLQ